MPLFHSEVDIVLSFISHFRDSNDKLMISWYSVAVFSMGWIVESVNLPMSTYILRYDMMHHWAYVFHFNSSFGSKMYLCMVPYLHWSISCSNFLFIWWTVCDHQILHIYSVRCHSVILCRTPPLGADPPAPRCGPMPAKRIQWSMTLFHQVPTGMTLAHLSSCLVHQKDVLITYLMEKKCA